MPNTLTKSYLVIAIRGGKVVFVLVYFWGLKFNQKFQGKIKGYLVIAKVN